MCEYPTFYSESHPIAARAHRCCECRGAIEPGEKYLVATGSWGGDFGTYKVCSDCEELRAQVSAGLGPYDDPLAFGYLLEYLYEGDCMDWLWDFFYVTQRRRSSLTDSVRPHLCKRWQVIWRVRYGSPGSHCWRIVPVQIYDHTDAPLYDLLKKTIDQIPADVSNPLNAIELLRVKCENHENQKAS